MKLLDLRPADQEGEPRRALRKPRPRPSFVRPLRVASSDQRVGVHDGGLGVEPSELEGAG